MEDRDSVLHLRNLSLQPANNKEEGGCGRGVWPGKMCFTCAALNWLFLGDTNRVMAEVWLQRTVAVCTLFLSPQTPMNMASTRSHCIFTIHISAREPGSDVIRRAKLHLVDLAG